MKNKILAIIGLRSGSTGLKNKNIKKLGKYPLFTYIQKSAKKSKFINKTIFSTDSKRYKKIIENFNGDVPFLRPKKISGNNAKEIDFIKDILNKLKYHKNYSPDLVVRLLATCPFQKSNDIDKLIKLVITKKYNSAVIISKTNKNPMKALRICGTKKKFLQTYVRKSGIGVGSSPNRQEFDTAYFRANVIVCRTEVINKFNSLTDKKPGFLLINNKKNVDIDNKIDFEYAKFLLKKK